MSPFSKERLDWIEARLFCLARMARDHAQEGQKRAQQYTAQNYQEAHAAWQAALAAIHVERLILMSERKVIDDYNEDQRIDGALRS